MDGSGSGTVIEPLLALEREDLTGALEFRANGVVTVVFVRAGEIGYATGGTIGETLGRILVRTGRLDEDHGISVVHHMIDQLVEREEARFGEILVDHGFLTADELELALAQQVREKLIGCVLRGRGDWVFYADDPRLEGVGSYVVGVRPMLMEAARRLSERRIEDILALSTPRFPEIVAPESVVAAEFELSPEETALLRDLDGTSSISFLRSKTSAHELLPFLAALVLGGGITMRVTPTSARRPSDSRSIPPAFRTQRRAKVGLVEGAQGAMASQAEHEDSTVALDAPAPGMPMPRLPESASTVAVVKPAHDRRSLRESFDAILPDAVERGKSAFVGLKAKLDARKPKSGRRRWPDAKNDRERRLMAASAFHKGRVYLRSEEAERALPGLHRALELRPQEPEYELYVKWAQMLLNDAFKDDARRNEVEHLAIKTVRADHLCELGWSVLGHIAHHDRNEEAALRFFQRALKLDPKLVDAARLVGLLANRQSSEPAIRASIADATERARRGALQTPLDELVPVRMIREKRSDRMLPKPPPRPGRVPNGQHTPRGGLVVGQGFVDSLAPVEPTVGTAALPPVQPKRASLPPLPTATPSPTSERTLAIAPSARGALTPPPQRTPSIVPPPSNRPAGLPPPSHPPPRLAPSEPPAEATRIMASIVPVAPGPGPVPAWHPPHQPHTQAMQPMPAPAPTARRHTLPDDLPTGRPKRGPLLAIVLLLALAGAGAAAFVLIPRRPLTPPTPVVTAPSASSPTPTPTPNPTPSPTPNPTPSPTPNPTPTPTPNPTPTPAEDLDASTPTTGILRSKALGHRVFVDGRLAGEAGRDMTVACGAHKVKVGSAGTERAVVVPCGGRLDVD